MRPRALLTHTAHAAHAGSSTSTSHLRTRPTLTGGGVPLAAMHGLRAYSWCAVYFVSICLSDTCGKHLISGLQWRSMWGPVLYTNLLATPVMCMFGLVGGEGPRLLEAEWHQRAVLLYGLSCVFGIAISFTGWRCRALVSATCYTVLGVANKMLTVLANIIVWDDHATPAASPVQERPR